MISKEINYLRRFVSNSGDTVWLTVAAAQVNSQRLDELAKWIVGHPHAFFEGVPHVRRVEPV